MLLFFLSSALVWLRDCFRPDNEAVADRFVCPEKVAVVMPRPGNKAAGFGIHEAECRVLYAGTVWSYVFNERFCLNAVERLKAI